MRADDDHKRQGIVVRKRWGRSVARIRLPPQMNTGIGTNNSIRFFSNRRFERGQHVMLLRLVLRWPSDVEENEPSEETGRALAENIKVGIVGLSRPREARLNGRRRYVSCRVIPRVPWLSEVSHLRTGAGAVAEIFIMLVADMDRNQLSYDMDCRLGYRSDTAEAFFKKRKLFDEWGAQNRKLNYSTHILEGAACSFYVRVDINGLIKPCFPLCAKSTVGLELLPQAALRRSWWVEAMGRSVESIPRTFVPDKTEEQEVPEAMSQSDAAGAVEVAGEPAEGIPRSFSPDIVGDLEAMEPNRA